MFCRKCGKELPDDSQFCLKCGNSLVAATAPAVQKPKPSGAMLGWILLAVVVAAGALYGGIEWYRSHSSGPSAPVAAILGTKEGASSGAIAPQPMSAQDIFQAASGAVTLITVFDDEGHQRGLGSGFVVSSDGTAVTNYHVIRGASKATAKFSDGLESDVSGVVAYDADHDVAVIKLATPPKTVLQLGDSDDTKVGESVVAIGSPLGFQNTLSQGIVSGVRNGVVQMSAPISPGSSGGPVLDSYGKVVGVSVAFVRGGEDLNFAVPINWAKPYLNSTAPKTLADVATENTVLNDFVDGSVSVPAGQSRNFSIVYNPNTMSDAEIHGQITSSGGMDGKITLAVFFGGQRIYQCRDTNCEIHQPLIAPGAYVVMIDNRISPMFGRTVSGKISLKYVK